MNMKNGIKYSLKAIALVLLCLDFPAFAQPKIAVLDFELRDLTLLPGIPEELARTASVKPMLEAELLKSGYEIVQIPLAQQKQAASGFGYLFDHHDLAAELAQKVNADYVVIGRLHKPSFLFIYLMAHLVDVKNRTLIGDYLSEVKGGEKKLTGKGVTSLARQIKNTFTSMQ